MARRGVVVATFVLVGLVSAGRASADDDKYAEGVAAFANKDYEGAIAAFKAAYTANPSPEILFAWAQAERLNGNCPAAIVLYKRFLAQRPDGVQADAVRAPLERCERAVASVPEGETPPPESQPSEPSPEDSVVVPPIVPAAQPPPQEPDRPFYKDALGDGLVVGGAVSLAVGVVFLLQASSADDAAAQATSYDEFGDDRDAAGRDRTIAAVALGVGAGLVVAGGVRWFLVGRGHHSEHVPAVSFGPTPHGFGVFAVGRF